GWYDSAGYEIGDKCAWDFPSGNGTTTLNNSGVFEMQLEYSNASKSCVNTYSNTPTPPPPPATPTITRFSPSSGAVGTRVTITGTNLQGVTSVTFNGVRATNASVNS